MRAVRFRKAEAALLRDLVDKAKEACELNRAEYVCSLPAKKALPLLTNIKLVLTAAEEPKEAGVNAAAFERALMEKSNGKIVPVESSGYARVSRQATQLGATIPAATMVGAWVASQAWLRGPLTVFTVLNKWPDWLARAKVTAPPDGLEEGIGAGDLGSGAPAKRPASAAGRRAPGIG